MARRASFEGIKRSGTTADYWRFGRKTPDWDTHERAEALLEASGIEIRHDQADRAFYRPATDRIHLPGRESFSSADAYFSTALHELGHYAGSRIMPSNPVNLTRGAARSV